MNERRHLIGGTDAASLLGLGRMSPTALYLRLRGEMPDDFEGNEATEAGELFESAMVAPLAERRFGMKLVRPDPLRLTLPDERRVGCSFDFAISGTDRFAEVKATGSRELWGNGDKLPVAVGAQAQFQMAVARANKRIIPCIHVISMHFPGFLLVDNEVEEDQELGGVLLERARAALRAADAGEPPTPGDEADARALFLGKRGEVYRCSDEDVEIIKQLRILAGVEKETAKQIAQLRNALLPKLGTATEIVTATGEVLATWRPNRVFDEAGLKAAHPAIYDACTKTVLDRDKLKKEHKKLAEMFMREPEAPADQVRPFKLKEE